MARGKLPEVANEYQAPEGWQLWHHPDTTSDGWECLLYSDTHIRGDPYYSSDLTLGPWKFFPTGADAGEGQQPTGQLVVRFEHASPHRNPTSARPNGSRWWLDQSLDEEIAGLLSLALGVRLRSGGMIRRLSAREDQWGEPRFHDHHAPGYVPVPARRVQFPGLRGSERKLASVAELVVSYSELTPTAAYVLAKAARQYSEALWIGDSDPEQAWLRLVTAMEGVAVYEQAETYTPSELFREAHSKAAKLIEAAGGVELLGRVAAEFKDVLLAGRRFRDFAVRYAPERPEIRPANLRDCFTWEQLDAAMRRIYGYRSDLLHEGKPFPTAMVGIKLEADDDGIYPECPHADTVYGSQSSSWAPGSQPMYLWTFAYIVRGAVVNWWQTKASQAAMSEESEGAA